MSTNEFGPELDLTTASELDGKPLEDDEQDEDENPQSLSEDDDDDGQDIQVPSRRNHKV
jgi:hypothetical protein